MPHLAHGIIPRTPLQIEREVMQIQQTELASGNRRMVCFLPRDPRVKVGTVISLAKSDRRWRVLEQHAIKEYQEVNRDWKVGGLA